MTTSRSSPRAEGVIVLGVAYLLVRGFWMFSGASGRAFDSAVIEAMTKVVLWCGVILPIGLWLARRRDLSLLDAFGLGGGALKGVGFGLAATLPMIGALFLIPLEGFHFDFALGSGIIGPFAEELLFRGFLFGLLWRVAGWSIPASILVSSLLFGFAHIPNADRDLFFMLRGPEVLGTALPLAAGGAVLAWVAYRWNSLWPAIALHGCMNLWWDATRGEHASPTFGPDLMSVAQVLSVMLAILISLRFGTSGTPGMSGTSGERNPLSHANDLQLRIVDKLQAPRT